MIKHKKKSSIAYSAFSTGNYFLANEMYESLSIEIGKNFFHANIEICKKRMVVSNPQIQKPIIIQDKTNPNNIKTLNYDITNRTRESICELLLADKKNSLDIFLREFSADYRRRIFEQGAECFYKLQKILTSSNKKVLLIAGHDLRFVQPYINYLSTYYEILIDKWTGLADHDENSSLSLLNKADIVWCEWCCGNAVFYSKNKKAGTKVFVRMHRFEYTTNFPNIVQWENVDKLLFIAEGIKEKFVEKFNPKCPLSIVYNSFDVDDFVFKSHHSKKKLNTICILGFIPKLKRPDIAIDLLEYLAGKGADFDLYLKGKKPEELNWVWSKEKDYFGEIYKRIEKQSNSVYIEGYDGNVAEWLSSKGFLISSSDIEGSHQAVAEAMAAGVVPIIIGKWAWEYKSYRMYPSEFIFNSVEDAGNFILDTIDKGRYESLSMRVQQFAIENFSPDVVMHSVLENLQDNCASMKYTPIKQGLSVAILSDLNVNVVDGSSVWLRSLVEMLLLDRNICVSVFLKDITTDKSMLEGLLDNPSLKIFEFSAPGGYSDSSFFSYCQEVERSIAFDKIIVRAGLGLSSEMLKSGDHILSRVIYYIAGDCKISLDSLSLFDSILVQTNDAKSKLQASLEEKNIFKNISVLSPMIPDNYNPKFREIGPVLQIVYSGKLCRDYMALEMANFANQLSPPFFFNIVASKYYKPDGEDYIRKTKAMLASAVKKGFASLKGPITREETSDVIKESHVGWLLRDEKFLNSSEISTKLLEYCALGKPVLLNKYKANVELLGEDYPLFVSTVQELNDRLIYLQENPKEYKLISDYCAHVSNRYKMTNAFKRIFPVIFSREGSGLEVDRRNSYNEFVAYSGFTDHGISFHDLRCNWALVSDNGYSIKIAAQSTVVNLAFKVMYPNVANGDTHLVKIKVNGENRRLPNWKITNQGESFQYIRANGSRSTTATVVIPVDNIGDEFEFIFHSWRYSGDALLNVVIG